MSIYKHKESGKCLSFGNVGSYVRGSLMLLEDCPSNLVQEIGNKNNYFRIKKSGNAQICAQPSSEPGFKYNLKFGDCVGNHTLFSKHTKNLNMLENKPVNHIDVHFTFKRNWNGPARLTGKQMINYVNDGKNIDLNNYNIFYRLTNVSYKKSNNKNETYTKVTNENHISDIFQNGGISMLASISLYYESKNKGVPDIGPFYFKLLRKTNGNPIGVVLTKDKPNEELRFYFWKLDLVLKSEMHKINTKNDQEVIIGIYIDGENHKCYYSESFPQGLTTSKSGNHTVFNMILRNDEERFQFLETLHENKRDMTIRSFQNPATHIRYYPYDNHMRSHAIWRENDKDYELDKFAANWLAFQQPDARDVITEGFVSSQGVNNMDVSSQGVYNMDSNFVEKTKEIMKIVNQTGTNLKNLNKLKKVIYKLNTSLIMEEFHIEMADLLDNIKHLMILELKLKEKKEEFYNPEPDSDEGFYDDIYKNVYDDSNSKFKLEEENAMKTLSSMRTNIEQMEVLIEKRDIRKKNINEFQEKNKDAIVQVDVNKLILTITIETEKNIVKIFNNFLIENKNLYINLFVSQGNNIFDIHPNQLNDYSSGSFDKFSIEELNKEIDFLNKININNFLGLQDKEAGKDIKQKLKNLLTQIRNNKTIYELAKISNQFKYPTSKENLIGTILSNMNVYFNEINGFLSTYFDGKIEGNNYFGVSNTIILGYRAIYKTLTDETKSDASKLISIYIILNQPSFINDPETSSRIINGMNKVIIKFNNIYNTLTGMMFINNEYIRNAYSQAKESKNIESTNINTNEPFTGMKNIFNKNWFNFGGKKEGMVATVTNNNGFFNLGYNVTTEKNKVIDSLRNGFVYNNPGLTLPTKNDKSENWYIDACYNCLAEAQTQYDGKLSEFISDVTNNCNNVIFNKGELTLIIQDDNNNKIVKLVRKIYDSNDMEIHDEVVIHKIPMSEFQYFEPFTNEEIEKDKSEIVFNHKLNSFKLLQKNHSLYDKTKMIKLKLTEDGKLILVAKEKTLRTINHKSFDIHHGVGYTKENENLGHVYNIPNSNLDKFINVLDNLYYIDNTGQMTIHNDKNIIRSKTGLDTMNYKGQLGYKFDKDKLKDKEDGNEDTKKDQCTKDPNCRGYFKSKTDGLTVKVDKDDFKHIIYDNINREPSEFFMKMNEISGSKFDPSFPRLVKELSYFQEPFSANIKKKEPFIEGMEETSYHTLGKVYTDLSSNYNEYKQAQNEFQSDFNDFVTAFNELSEQEIKMLQQTNIKLTDLKNLVNTYHELYEKSNNNIKIKELVYNQAENSYVSHKNSEYSMALAGILSIGSLMYLFTKVK